jgi:hypothetical protein
MAVSNKKHFDIKRFDVLDGLQQIHAATRGFQIDLAYISKMTAAIYTRKHTWFGFIDAAHDYMKQIIGKNGYHLKQLTQKYGADLIWHDQTDNKFLVWASKPVLISTLYALQRHMERIVSKHIEDIAVLETGVKEMNVIKPPCTSESESISISSESISISSESSNNIHYRDRLDENDVDEPLAKKIKYTLFAKSVAKSDDN